MAAEQSVPWRRRQWQRCASKNAWISNSSRGLWTIFASLLSRASFSLRSSIAAKSTFPLLALPYRIPSAASIYLHYRRPRTRTSNRLLDRQSLDIEPPFRLFPLSTPWKPRSNCFVLLSLTIVPQNCSVLHIRYLAQTWISNPIRWSWHQLPCSLAAHGESKTLRSCYTENIKSLLYYDLWVIHIN